MFAGIDEPNGLEHMFNEDISGDSFDGSGLLSREAGLIAVFDDAVDPTRCLISDGLMRRIEEMDCLREDVNDFKVLEVAAPPVEVVAISPTLGGWLARRRTSELVGRPTPLSFSSYFASSHSWDVLRPDA
jgi:hypothetical protein